MKRKVRLLLISLAVVVVVLTAVYFRASGSKQEVKNVVITYNRVLAKAQGEMKPNMMERLTSLTQLSKIDNYLAYLLKNKKTIVSEMKDISFNDINVGKEQAVVVTKERWIYYYVDPVSRMPVSEEYDVIYGNTYQLKKVKGAWVVDNIESRELGGKTEG